MVVEQTPASAEVPASIQLYQKPSSIDFILQAPLNALSCLPAGICTFALIHYSSVWGLHAPAC